MDSGDQGSSTTRRLRKRALESDLGSHVWVFTPGLGQISLLLWVSVSSSGSWRDTAAVMSPEPPHTVGHVVCIRSGRTRGTV